MDIPYRGRADGPLASRIAPDACPAAVAAATVAVWADIDRSLIPVVGKRGLGALYSRSVQLTGHSHPWLVPERFDTAQPDADTTALAAALAGRSGADARESADAFFQNFHDLLVSLVGPSLTERMLRSAWADVYTSGKPAQDLST